MTFATLAVAFFASALVLMLRPVDGLVTYIAVQLLYPSYLAVSLGTVDITADRIVIAVLLCRALMDRSLVARFRRITLDYFVVGSFGVLTLALCLQEALPRVLENRAGAFLDAILPYFAARLIIQDRSRVLRLAKGLAMVLIPVAALGVMESLTAWSPYAGLRRFSFISTSEGGPPDLRWGLYRAGGAIGNSISFGLCFVVLLPMVLVLLGQRGTWKTLGFIAAASGIAGVFSSMSSGPLLGLVVFGGAAALSLQPVFAKPALWLALLAFFTAELGSNRHFYYLIGYLTFSGRTAWYRGRLIDVSVERLSEYWLSGYGFKDPGWGPSLDMRSYTDVCNEYILMACRGGIFTTILFVGALATALTRLRRVFRTASDPVLKMASWYLGSMVVGLAVAMMSVGLLGVESLFFTMLGVIGSPAFDVCRQSKFNLRPVPPQSRPLALDVQARYHAAQD